MRRTNIPILEITAATSLAVIAFTVALLLFPTMNSEVAAAWVQAIGSIVAIVAAFLIPMYQHQKNRESAEEDRTIERVRLLKKIQEIIIECEALLKAAHDAFHSGSRNQLDYFINVIYQQGHLSDIAKTIEQIPLHTVPGETFGLIAIRNTLFKVDEYLAYFKDGKYTDENYRKMVERLEKDWHFAKGIRESLSTDIIREGVKGASSARIANLFGL